MQSNNNVIDTYFVRLILNYLYKLAMEQPELYYSCSFFFYRYLLILHDWFGITYNDHETIQIIIYYSRINSLVLVFNRKIASFLRNIFYCSTFYCLLSFICIRSHYHVLCDHAGKPHHIKRLVKYCFVHTIIDICIILWSQHWKLISK